MDFSEPIHISISYRTPDYDKILPVYADFVLRYGESHIINLYLFKKMVYAKGIHLLPNGIYVNGNLNEFEKELLSNAVNILTDGTIDPIIIHKVPDKEYERYPKEKTLDINQISGHHLLNAEKYMDKHVKDNYRISISGYGRHMDDLISIYCERDYFNMIRWNRSYLINQNFLEPISEILNTLGDNFQFSRVVYSSRSDLQKEKIMQSKEEIAYHYRNLPPEEFEKKRKEIKQRLYKSYQGIYSEGRSMDEANSIAMHRVNLDLNDIFRERMLSGWMRV